MRLLAIVTEKFEDLEAIGTIALLRRAGIEVDLAGASDQRMVTGSFHTSVQTDIALSEVEIFHYDGLFLPGGAHTKALREQKEVLGIVSAFYEQHKWLMAICAAPSILGVLGILDGVSYTCFPGMETFMPLGKKQAAAAVVDGKIITGAGAGAVHEFAFAIIEALLGVQKSEEIKQRIIYRAYE